MFDCVLCILKKGAKKVAMAKTDNFGDFWFEGLDVGQYSVSISKPGYLSQEIKPISTEKDVNLGDIKLYKEESVEV